MTAVTSGKRQKKTDNQFSGSSFDEFLVEKGILEEVTLRAHKCLLAMQIADIMNEANLSKSDIAERMHTSRSQIDRLLDPDNTAVTLESLDRLVRTVGRQLRIEFA